MIARAAWPSSLLDDVARRGSGHTPTKSRPDYWDGEIHWVSLRDTFRLDNGLISETTSTISEKGLANSSAVLHPAGTVILLRDAGIGKSGIIASEMAVSQHFIAWDCGPRLRNWFLYYVLQARKGEFERISNGSTIRTIGLDYFRQMAVPLPDLDEQDRIVDVLRSVDELINALDRQIAKKCAIKQGIMQELLTGRTRLPGFAEPWRAIRFGDHVSYVKNVALPRAQLDSASPLRYLHYGDIHTRSASVLDASAEDMPRVSNALARNAGVLQVGDLVFADASEDPDGVGRSVEIIGVPIDGVIPGLHTIAARFDKHVLADGFKGYLQFITAFRTQLLALASGTKVLATTRAYISSIELTLPNVVEQAAIAEVLHDADTEIAALERRLESTRAIKQGMMQELLTGRTRLMPTETSA